MSDTRAAVRGVGLGRASTAVPATTDSSMGGGGGSSSMYAICNCRLATTDQLGGSERDGEGGDGGYELGEGLGRYLRVLVCHLGSRCAMAALPLVVRESDHQPRLRITRHDHQPRLRFFTSLEPAGVLPSNLPPASPVNREGVPILGP